MILVDLFSGIGGFHLGLKNAGIPITKTYFSEVDQHAIAVYKNNFPNAEYIGSVTTIPDDIRGDIVTFGSPCQDFSLAGKRKGMGGGRSSLIRYAIEFIAKTRPSVFIWENVKGAFSSNAGADFWAIIQAFANLRGYRLEWQLVNTKWLLPQNRERIYLIGHLAEQSTSEVFPFRESDFRTTKGESKASIVRTITAGGNSGGHHLGMTLIKKVGQINSSQDGQVFDEKGISQCLSAGHGNVPKILQRGRGFVKNSEKDNCPTISGGDFSSNHAVKVKQINSSNESNGNQPYQQNRIYCSSGLSPSLTSQQSKPNKIKVRAISSPDRMNKKQNSRRIKGENDPSFTLTVQDRHGVQINETIRRLTEIECERLQGFPDNWTKYGEYPKKDGTLYQKAVSKTQRYKLLGNAVTAKIVEMIGLRLIKGLKINGNA